VVNRNGFIFHHLFFFDERRRNLYFPSASSNPKKGRWGGFLYSSKMEMWRAPLQRKERKEEEKERG
jgi:hypothetical protein